MEVHHHPDLHHNRKKFREYLLEFVMIFLAVSLGFIAENVREKISDREKEKHYVESLVNNLKDDTANFASAIAENTAKVDSLQKMVLLSRKSLADTAVRRALYHYVSWASHYSIFRSNDATMMQLKNSDGFRYIRRPHVADSIANYDNVLKYVYSSEELYVKASQEAMEAAAETIDFSVGRDSTFMKSGERWNPGVMPPLLSTDPQKIHQLFNKMDLAWGWTDNYIRNMKERLPTARRLIAFLQKEYDLD
jgi:hypothetical protein